MTKQSAKHVEAAGRRALEIDVFEPDSANGVAVILVHGGGWASGNKAMMHGYAQALAEQGFVAIAAEYRLLPEAPWPTQIEDLRDVVRWTKANAAELRIDPAKVALQGYSAGGHVCLLVAGTAPGSGHETAFGGDASATEVAAVVSFFAPGRFPTDPERLAKPPLNALIGDRGAEGARAASPVEYVHKDFPSTFIIGGMGDYMQPVEAGIDLLQAFTSAGAEVEFHYFHSQVHEFPSTPTMLREVMNEVAFFYRRTLIDREALLEEAKAGNPFARASSMPEFMEMMARAQQGH